VVNFYLHIEQKNYVKPLERTRMECEESWGQRFKMTNVRNIQENFALNLGVE
jgi:hypothetical protein